MGELQLQQMFKQMMPVFADYLRSEGLIIVKAEEHEQLIEAKITKLQRKYLKLNALTLKQIEEAELLPDAKSRSTLMRLIKDKELEKTNEAYKNSKQEWMILVSTIKKLAPHLK